MNRITTIDFRFWIWALFSFYLLSAQATCQAQGALVRRDATVAAVEKALPSVVNISTKTVIQRRGLMFDWFRESWAPYSQQLPPQYSAGSGVIIDEEGYVISNVHVVEGATEISVTLADKRIFPAEVVIGARKTDVALLKIKAKPGERFVPVKMAADDDLLLGETVIALGNPFGLGGSVSRGILSSKTRRADTDHREMDVEDWIQTDAAINPGNSGGPLVNLDGELIGLNVAVFREGQGIGFAIPVKRISEALSEIVTPESLKGLWFGAQFRATTNLIKVANLQTGSPADKAGLKQDDLILKVNNVQAKSVLRLNQELIAAGHDRDISFSIQRGKERKNISVRLVPESSFFNTKLIQQKLGVLVRELSATTNPRENYGLNSGLLITGIEEGSPADSAGFQKGLVIESIDGKVPGDLTTAAKWLFGIKKGQTVKLTLLVPSPLRRAVVELKVR